MLPAEEIAKITGEIKKLESALEACTDGRIREVIEIRIEERTLRLHQLQSLPSERLQQRPQQRKQRRKQQQ